MRALDVVYTNGKNEEKISISEAGYKIFKKDIETKGYKIISITERIPEKQPIDKNIIDKRRFYNSQFSTEIRRKDRGAISQEEYERRLDILKRLMPECKTAREYKAKYKKEM